MCTKKPSLLHGYHQCLVLSCLSLIHTDLRCQEVEKEKQDTNSPRGALEACLTRCSISSTSSSLDDPPPNREAVENADAEARIKNHRASSNWGKFFKHWKRKSMKRLSSFPPLAHRRNKNADTHVDGLNVHDIYDFQSSLHSFSITDLEIATDNFSPGNEFKTFLMFQKKKLPYNIILL